MSSPIKTNQLIYELKHDGIDARYDIFTVETSAQYFQSGASIIDRPVLEKNVKAVRFETGKRFHVLMNRAADNKQLLRKALSDDPLFDAITLEQVRSQSLDYYIMLQLLLNSLGSAEHHSLKFNNLTGHLYCFHPEWLQKSKKDNAIFKVPCLELRITPEYRLRFDVRTFTSVKLRKKIKFDKNKFEDYPQYVLSAHNTLRRKVEGDKGTAFIQRQVDGEKTGNIDFLSIDSLKHFESSKMGVLDFVLKKFNSKFTGLAEIGFADVPEYDSLDYDKNVKKENAAIIQSALAGANIRIVDGIGDDTSKEVCKQIQAKLLEKYVLSAQIGRRITKGHLNIYLIHNADHYSEGDDPYYKSYPDTAVQHITFEDFAGNIKYALSTVIHELLIKSDLKAGKISLFDWESLKFTEDIEFGMRTKDDDGRELYYFMKIHPNGSFDIREQELTLFEAEEYINCKDVFTQADNARKTIKGIIRDSHGNINSIVDTGWITIPEIALIHEELSKGNTSLRNKEKREELLTSVTDIHKFEQDNNIYYFVGAIGNGMNHKLHTAANIRKIETWEDSPNLFGKLLPLMNVKFVRNEQLTVIPFPFKYLREYIRTINSN